MDGRVPTDNTRSHLIVADVQRARTLVPHEMLLLHGFPLHRMVIPASIKGADLQSMAGNTMHIPVVGAAMVMTLLLIDWRLPSAHRSGDASHRLNRCSNSAYETSAEAEDGGVGSQTSGTL